MNFVNKDITVPSSVKIVGVKINGVHTDIVINEFSNCILVNVSQCGKLGTFISVAKEGAKQLNGSDVYSVRTLLGRDSVAHQTAARFLHERTCMTKPAVFSLDVADCSVRTLKALERVLLQHRTW